MGKRGNPGETRTGKRGGNVGTSMISKVKGETEVSLHFFEDLPKR